MRFFQSKILVETVIDGWQNTKIATKCATLLQIAIEQMDDTIKTKLIASSTVLSDTALVKLHVTTINVCSLF